MNVIGMALITNALTNESDNAHHNCLLNRTTVLVPLLQHRPEESSDEAVIGPDPAIVHRQHSQAVNGLKCHDTGLRSSPWKLSQAVRFDGYVAVGC